MGNEHELMKEMEKSIDKLIDIYSNDETPYEFKISQKILLLAEQKKEFKDNNKMQKILNSKIHYEKCKLFGVYGQPEKTEEEKKKAIRVFLYFLINQLDVDEFKTETQDIIYTIL